MSTAEIQIIHIALLETRHFSPLAPLWIAYGFRIGNWALNSDWSLQYNIVGRAVTRSNICCMLEKMFDRNQNILPTKSVKQTSSNMHATRSNIVDPTNVL